MVPYDSPEKNRISIVNLTRQNLLVYKVRYILQSIFINVTLGLSIVVSKGDKDRGSSVPVSRWEAFWEKLCPLLSPHHQPEGTTGAFF